MATDTEDKIANPAAYYETPGDVLNDQELSYEEKSRALESMKLDAQRLETSSAENMAGGERPPNMQDIEEALRAIREDMRR